MWTWCRGGSGGCSRPCPWSPTSTRCGRSSLTTSASPTSSPTSSRVGRFRVRMKDGYGWRREACSALYRMGRCFPPLLPSPFEGSSPRMALDVSMRSPDAPLRCHC